MVADQSQYRYRPVEAADVLADQRAGGVDSARWGSDGLARGAPRGRSGRDLLPVQGGGFPTPPLDLGVPATPRSLAHASLIASGAPANIPSNAPTTQPEADRG